MEHSDLLNTTSIINSDSNNGDSFLSKCYNAIGRLPQYNAINSEDIKAWLSKVRQYNTDEKVAWMIERLHGIGGSEIGAVIANIRNEFSFNSIQDIANAKLMRHYHPPNGDMVRGNQMEDVIRHAFYRKVGCERANDEYNHLSFVGQNGPIKGFEFLRGNVDDVISYNKKLYIVDYKAPKSSPRKYRENPPLAYVCQLNAYGTFAQVEKIPVSGLLLVAWDYGRWEPVVSPINFDGKLVNDMLIHGDALFSDIKKGIVPPFKKQAPKIDLGDKPEIREQMNRYAICSKAAELYQKKADTIQEGIEGALENNLVDPKSQALQGVAVVKGAIKSLLDNDGLEEVAIEMGIDVNAFRKPGQINYKDLYEKCKEHATRKGVDIDHLVTDAPSVKVYLSRSKKADISEKLTALEASINESMDKIIDCHSIHDALNADSEKKPNKKKKKSVSITP